MVRSTWKVQRCLFLQTNELGELRVRAADEGIASKSSSIMFIPAPGSPFARCLKNNELIEMNTAITEDSLASLLNEGFKSTQKYLLVPVTGEARVLGMIILGPFEQSQEMRSKESELRSAGALCAVLSAHWRLYDWMSQFIPQVNHELRTPLTAVQGSIDMVLGGMFGQVGSEVKQMLEMAHKGCERTVRAIEDYLHNQQPKP